MFDVLERLLADVGLQDGLGWDDLVLFAAGGVTVLTFLTLIFGPSLRNLAHFLAWWETFRDQWDGLPAAPGRDRVPGIPERVNAIDGELKRNGGSTVKDAVFDTKRLAEDAVEQVQAIADQVTSVAAQAVALDARIDQGDQMRAQILNATIDNMDATVEAFRLAGIAPPDYRPLPVTIVPNEPI